MIWGLKRGLFDVILWQLIFLEGCRISAYLIPMELKLTSLRNCQHQYFHIHGDSLVWRCKWPGFFYHLVPQNYDRSHCYPGNLKVPGRCNLPKKTKATFVPVYWGIIVVNNLSNCGRMFLLGGWQPEGGSALRFSCCDGHPLVVVSAGLKGHPFRCPETTMLKNRGKSKMNKIWKKDGKTRESNLAAALKMYHTNHQASKQ